MNLAPRFMMISLCLLSVLPAQAETWHQPFDAPRTQREERFEFSKKPSVTYLGKDKYQIQFEVMGYCDVTVTLLDKAGKIVRRLASGVLGTNAPDPFQKGSLKQTIYWDGKDDFEHYVRHPEQVHVSVALGLKPTFDRVLGWHPYDSQTWDVGSDNRAHQCIGVNKNGVFVMLGHATQLRHYRHDTRYNRTVIPPPANAPLKSLKNYTQLEIEPGRKVLHAHHDERANRDRYIRMYHYTRPVVIGNRMIIGKGNLTDFDTIDLETGTIGRLQFPPPDTARREAFKQNYRTPEFLSASHDGKRLYLSGYRGGGGRAGSWSNAVYTLDLEKKKPAKLFAGVPGEVGSDNNHFQYAGGVACDGQNRVYVCDPINGRIQVFAHTGTYLKSIKVKSALDIRINPTTGELYVLQVFQKSKNGRLVSSNPSHWNGPYHICRLSRLKSFEDPTESTALMIDKDIWKLAGSSGPLFALDYWAKPVRVWLGSDRYNLRVYEDRGDSLKETLDFREATKKAGQIPFAIKCGPPPHDHAEYLTVDASRDQVHLHSWRTLSVRWDLKTGASKRMHFPNGSFLSPRVFDGRGFVYAHLNPCITRNDPDQDMREVPFDYGTEPTGITSQTNIGGCKGVIQLKDQGYEGNAGGVGVNMHGDVAAVSLIAYVPKMDDNDAVHHALRDIRKDSLPSENSGSSVNYVLPGGSNTSYAAFKNNEAALKKRGESLYFVRRFQGRILVGSTIWVFDRTGELRSEDLIQGLGFASGVQIDNDGNLYTMSHMTKMKGTKPFLKGRLSVIGRKAPPLKQYQSATYLKTSPKGARIFSNRSPVPLESPPNRPMDIEDSWVEGASWLYAGIGPYLSRGSHHCNDWYKRCFVTENYRHSVGILDSNGNLIMHVGRYGNADSGRGKASLVKVGGDEIAFSYIQNVSASADYLCVHDIGNLRIISLKLDYHVRASAPIRVK